MPDASAVQDLVEPPRPGRGDGEGDDRPAPADGLREPLAAAHARLLGEVAPDAIVAIVRGGRVERAIGADPELIAALEQSIRAASSKEGDRVVTMAPGGVAWSGMSWSIGTNRDVVVLTASAGDAPDGPDAAAARRDLIGLDLVRGVLLADDRDHRDRLHRLSATARSLTETRELDSILSSIVESATSLLGADSGDMLLWDREAGTLAVVAVSDFPPEMLGFTARFGEGLSSQAILAQRTLEVEDYATYEHRIRALDSYDFGSVLCSPLIVRGEAIGAINIHARGRRLRFAPGASELLAAFAGNAAIAIDRARRYEREVVLARDLAESNRQLTRLLTMQQRLAEHVLLDGGPDGIARLLAEDLGRPVVIQDQLRRMVAAAAPDGSEAWRRLVHDAERIAPASRDPFTVAVRVGNDVAGHLLLSSDDDLGPIDRALVDAATTGVALAFAKVRAAIEVEERLRGETMAELLGGDYATEAAIAARAARLGHDLDAPHDMLVVRVADRARERAPDGRAPDGRNGADGVDRQQRALAAVRERLAALAPHGLAVSQGGSIVILIRAGGLGDPEPRHVADDVRATLAGLVGAGPVTIAIADRCTRPDDYAPASRLAREAVDLLIKLGRADTTVRVRDLGPYRLLLRASSREDLEEFAYRTLRPLLDPERSNGPDLLTTLRVYLEEDRVQRRVAERCFIHVNTVAYRLHRIRELLRVDLDDPTVVFDLTLALRILDLVGDESGPARPIAAIAAPA